MQTYTEIRAKCIDSLQFAVLLVLQQIIVMIQQKYTYNLRDKATAKTRGNLSERSIVDFQIHKRWMSNAIKNRSIYTVSTEAHPSRMS